MRSIMQRRTSSLASLRITAVDVMRDGLATGEYLDCTLGVPGARLTGPGAFVGDQREYV